MLGLIGLMGALLAGVVMDSFIPSGGDEGDGDTAADRPDEGQDGDLLSDTSSSAGMPLSGDNPAPDDPGESWTGTDGADIHSGQGGDDLIAGGAGADLLGGRDGDDTIDGGAGNDAVEAGAGADAVTGGAGDDQLWGGDGADTLDGGAGDDRLAGCEGDDSLTGGDGNDALEGGGGNDMLAGDAGDDAVSGGRGDDLLWGGAGADTVEGGDGNDSLWAGEDAEADFLNGGTGDDALHLGAGDWGNGGEGADSFLLDDHALSAGEVAHIADYDPAQDHLVIYYDATAHPDPQLSLSAGQDGSVTLMIDGVPLAALMNGAVPDLAGVELRAG